MSAEPLDAGGTAAPASTPTVRFDIEPKVQFAEPTKNVTTMHDDQDDGPELAQIEVAPQTFLHSPPDSNNVIRSDPSDSELSDLEGDVSDPASKVAPADDIGDVEPDHYTDGVPVFKPTAEQFKDFKLFMDKVDKYGMKSGIIKIIPPDEWKAQQPPLDDLVKTIRVREPIKQDIMGSNGTYRQVNFVHGRVYTVRQWRELCEQSEHQPPSRRGERRMHFERPKPPTRPKPAAAPKKSAGNGNGRKRRGRPRKSESQANDSDAAEIAPTERPMTPVSDKQDNEEGRAKGEPEKTTEGKNDGKSTEGEITPARDTPMQSIEAADPGQPADDDGTPTIRRMGAVRQGKTQSTSARRKYSRREGSAMIDEQHFEGWDYRMDVSDFTRERCEELERTYWKTLTYAQPLYGADLMGTLFDDRTESWNLNKLPNLLDVMGTRVPGVNTAYLYLGMWKATFAWHLEDVDLYSINYLHFGAPKQWYSIAQGDARRFEQAMKSIWPTEAKACDQFLRHKSFLISPTRLLANYNIRVNKCVSYPGEFVVTYPYGYHSGYNLGYNCAEAVNFALDSWLPMGKIAKKCTCALAQDSVWIDVYDIERKLRGEETPEYEETEDEDDDEEEDEDDEDPSSLPTPPGNHSVRMKLPSRKRKRPATDKGKKKIKKVKKVRLRVKAKVEPPCCLCPHEIPLAELLPTGDGRKAHRMCALYLPETYVETVDSTEVVENIAGITKERLDLKCLYCRSKRGACFQCSHEKCTRSYHATCAAAAGVFVEEGNVPVFGEDGTEYKEQAFEFSCRFHRTKRDKRLDGDKLEEDVRIRNAAAALKSGDICQMQYYRGDIFAGVVVENRTDEETLLLDIIPKGDRVEVQWKWLLVADEADYRLPKASANAIPLPSSRKAKDELNAKRADDVVPRKGAEFAPGYTWAEFVASEAENKDQVRVDMGKEANLWHYLGKTSTDAKAQYTEDLARPWHNPKSNYLDTLPKSPKPVLPPAPRRTSTAVVAPPTAMARATAITAPMPTQGPKPDKPYVYKPRTPVAPDPSIKSWRNPLDGHAATPASSTSMSSPLPNTITSQRFEPNLASGRPSYLSGGMDVNMTMDGGMGVGMKANVGVSIGSSSISTTANPALPPQRVWPTQQLAAPAPRTSGGFARQTVNQPAVPPSPTLLHRYGAFFHRHSNRCDAASVNQFPQFASYSHSSADVQNRLYRDSHKFRTPYSQLGGYTNGYEGNLLSYLMKGGALFSGAHNAQHSAQPSPATGMMTPSIPTSTPYVQAQYHSSPQTHMQARFAVTSLSGPNFHSPPPSSISVSTASPIPTYGQSVAAAHTLPMQSQHSFSAPHSAYALNNAAGNTSSTPTPMPTPAPQNGTSRVGLEVADPSLSLKVPKYKIPTQQTPVPLPANFLAAMRGSSNSSVAGSSSTTASPSPSALTPTVVGDLEDSHGPMPTTEHSPTSTLMTTATAPTQKQPTNGQQVKSTSPAPTTFTPLAKAPAPIPSIASSGDAPDEGPIAAPPPAPKVVSTTPVPLPRIPGMARPTSLPKPRQVSAPAPRVSKTSTSPVPLPDNRHQNDCSIYSPQPVSSSAYMPTPTFPAATAQPPPYSYSNIPQSMEVELPDVGPDSTALMEKIMSNLRRASGAVFM